MAFFAENGRKGLKHPFFGSKSGGTFFLGGVKKHELGVGNYPESGRIFFSFRFSTEPPREISRALGTLAIPFKTSRILSLYCGHICLKAWKKP